MLNNSTDWITNYRNRIEKSKQLFFKQTERSFVTADASRKFTKNGDPRHFSGWSIVHFLTPEHTLMQHLVHKQTQFLKAVQASGIASKFAFLPHTTYHMTLVGIATNQPQSLQKKIVSGVNECFNLFKTEEIRAPRIRIRGDLSPDVSTIIAPIEPADKRSLDTMYYIRQKVREILHPLGEDVVRNTPENFHGHITLAYIVNPLSEMDYKKLKEILKMFERSDDIGTSVIDTISLHHFETMIDWGSSISTMRLPHTT